MLIFDANEDQESVDRSMEELRLGTSLINSKVQVELQANEGNWQALAKTLGMIQSEQASLKKNIEDLQGKNKRIESSIHEYDQNQKRQLSELQELCAVFSQDKSNFHNYQHREASKLEKILELCMDMKTRIDERLGRFPYPEALITFFW
ncbi:uncharacterized protein MELLADRAFT_90920 [Melampsora larici-populina 98AG31]|uniref:Uncharacterized protein n=1 Tax=Melampsora larici-populina (strain 98AG31 / pathotype 3-4-7) TaxID=747676 RepID=F4R817_MELLP|nr:uncharacterized protein MELLADRAFT_90920 [Melampsora larici-populina 98AG31]EGG11692.1 hypothetical protein MELLADRAFT_90920 [Melampsora larici-populina 98AG31]